MGSEIHGVPTDALYGERAAQTGAQGARDSGTAGCSPRMPVYLGPVLRLSLAH